MIESEANLSCRKYPSYDAIEALLSLRSDVGKILDTTYGLGTFWKGSERQPTFMDVNPDRAKNLNASFLSLPFDDNAYGTVIYDPPFHPGSTTAEKDRYGTMGKNSAELEVMFRAGLQECYRVSQKYVLVKCQGFMDGGRPRWMQLWAVDELGEPFEWLVSWRQGKRISGSWKTVRSLRRNHSDYLLFSKRSNWH